MRTEAQRRGEAAYRERNRERLREKAKLYYRKRGRTATDCPVVAERRRRASESQIQRLNDAYVALTLRIPVADCPRELLDAKRAQLLVKRELRKRP